MKVLLVHPGGEIGGIATFWNFTVPITLPYLAALAPPEVQVEIRYMGQRALDADYEADYDLVGISSLTTHAGTAFRLADRFRELGRKVVIGGIHATLSPDRALQHCDAVAVGEAEELWPRIIRDAASGQLKKLYENEKLPDLNGIPCPRYDLLNLGDEMKKIYLPVLTSKGCPNRCEYCFIPEIFGGKLRNRPVEDVINDIRAIVEKMKVRKIAFVDDNIIGNRKLAKELFREMIPLNVEWCGECTLDIADDRDLLDLANRSGCSQLSVGMESVNRESLLEAGKRCNLVERYPDQIREIQKRKILLVANIMFGFDHDTKETLADTARSLTRWKVHLIAPFILRPIIGTRLFKRLEQEGRLLPEALGVNTRTDIATFVPKNMTPEELENAFREVPLRFYSLPSIIRRLFLPPATLPANTLLLNLLANLKLIQWPRLKHAPLLGRVLSPLKSFLKARLTG